MSEKVCGRGMGDDLFFRPVWKYHRLSWWSCRVPRFGFVMSGVKIVAGALLLNHEGSWCGSCLMMLDGVTFGLYGFIMDSGR